MTTKKRITVSLDRELEEMVESYRHRYHLANSSTACEQLIRRGLSLLSDEDMPTIDTEGIRSRIREIERLLNEGTQ